MSNPHLIGGGLNRHFLGLMRKSPLKIARQRRTRALGVNAATEAKPRHFMDYDQSTCMGYPIKRQETNWNPYYATNDVRFLAQMPT